MTVENPKKLGFGLMRLPKRGLAIDIKQMSQMVDLFLEAGCTYFDTAHVAAPVIPAATIFRNCRLFMGKPPVWY